MADLKGRVVIALLWTVSLSLIALPQDLCRGETDSGWGYPEPIEYISYNAGSVEIAVEASGNAIAVWAQYDGDHHNILSNRYVLGYGWLTTEIIGGYSENAYSPQISIDDSGNAMAVWIQSSNQVWAGRYDAELGWSEVVCIAAEPTDVWAVDVAMAPDGTAVAVWSQDDGVANSVWANVYDPDEGWGVPEVIDSEIHGIFMPRVAMDSTGNATVVWYDLETSTNHIWANIYNPESGWGTAQRVEYDETHTAVYPAVSMDGSGNALVVWNQYGDPLSDIWANRYDADTGWGTPELLEEYDGGGAYDAFIDFDGTGNAIAVWRQSDGVTWNATANRYVTGVGWGEPEFIEAYDSGLSSEIRIAVNADGVGFAVWRQHDGLRYNICANRYLPGDGWGEAAFVEMASGQCAPYSSIGVDGAGNAIAAWAQDEFGTDSIFANRYVVADTDPPALVVTSPVSGAETNIPSVSVVGETEIGAELYVNGILTHVDDATGAFATTVALLEGENEIVATAVDSWENAATVSVTVTYIDPITDLQTQIEELIAQLEKLTGGSNTSETNLTALNEELAALRDLLNSTTDELEEVSERLDALDDNSSASESDTSDSPSMSLILGLVSAVALLLLVVMVALHVNLRKEMGRTDRSEPEHKEPPPPE